MQDQLSCFFSGIGKSGSVNDVVQTAFQITQQVFTGHTGSSLCHFIVVVELVFRYAVETFCFLFRAQLNAIFGNFFAALAMLAGNSAFPGYDCTFIGIASLTLQEQLLAFSSAQSAGSTSISCHMVIPP